ncbi:tetratricopeptide repeat protein [Psychroflexus lacisalsi]|jgi:Tfp pilus assembly protein PilF|uniref:Tetratricopeptide repeat protein n=1 Tax=Psychroflexus lacisalsi TaxID=503928 RepID=A0ABN1K141_9FLAO|nr:hypothetical protein [Psychroflexus lacisalsi]MBZ9620770.1 hypothetical protein [Psychroflexus lacisalsi]
MNSQNKLHFILVIVHLFVGAQYIYGQNLDSLYAVGEYSKVLMYFETYPPSSFKNKILEAKSLQSKNFNKKAIDSYHDALIDKKDQPVDQFTYAKLLKSNTQYKEADSLLTLLSYNYPTNPEFLYQLGLAKAELKNKSEEISFEKALEQDPSHQGAAYELSKFYFRIKSYEKAETINLDALQFNPKNKRIIGLLGQIYYAQKKFKLALEQFESLEKLTSPPKFVLQKMAIGYNGTNQLDKAIQKYEQLLKIEQRSSKYHLQLALLYAKKENFKESEYNAQLAILYKDVSLSGERFTKAIAMKENGKLKAAIKVFGLVIEEAPMFERAYVEMALTADRLYEDVDKKLSFYDQYEDQFGDYEYAEFKPLMSRRITDLKREKHFSGK